MDARSEKLESAIVGVGERVVDRLSLEAKKRPKTAAAVAVAELVGTVVVYGLAPAVLATTSALVVYRALVRDGRDGGKAPRQP